MKTIEKSRELFEKAKTLAPGGVHSPVRAFGSVGGTPVFFTRGKGGHCIDADGNDYLDFCQSWGPLIPRSRRRNRGGSRPKSRCGWS